MLLSLTTLLLGVAAVVLPCAAALAPRAIRRFTSAIVLVSAVLAMASLVCVIVTLQGYAAKGDTSSFFDTIDAFAFCSVALLILTVLANTILLWRVSYRARQDAMPSYLDRED